MKALAARAFALAPLVTVLAAAPLPFAPTGSSSTSPWPADPGAPTWGDPDLAVVYPGARIIVPGPPPQVPGPECVDQFLRDLTLACVQQALGVQTGCTFGFFFADPLTRSHYASTAAHCVPGLDATMHVDDGEATPVGRVVYDSRENHAEPIGLPGAAPLDRVDFALIRLDDAVLARSSPRMATWGGPVGLADAGSDDTGHTVAIHGHGALFHQTGVLDRTGILVSHADDRFTVILPVTFGDSGGPVLDLTTGEALGTVHGIDPAWYAEHLADPASTPAQRLPYVLEGTPVAAQLEAARQDGFHGLRLATAARALPPL